MHAGKGYSHRSFAEENCEKRMRNTLDLVRSHGVLTGPG